MSHLDDLRAAVNMLEEAYDAAKASLEKDMVDVHPLAVTSADGRFILLDSLTEIVRARTVLVELTGSESEDLVGELVMFRKGSIVTFRKGG